MLSNTADTASGMSLGSAGIVNSTIAWNTANFIGGISGGTFTGPAAGASLAPSVTFGLVNAQGWVTLALTAGSITGAYPVTITAAGLRQPEAEAASFSAGAIQCIGAKYA